jgi:hypothetical protein
MLDLTVEQLKALGLNVAAESAGALGASIARSELVTPHRWLQAVLRIRWFGIDH